MRLGIIIFSISLILIFWVSANAVDVTHTSYSAIDLSPLDYQLETRMELTNKVYLQEIRPENNQVLPAPTRFNNRLNTINFGRHIIDKSA